MEEVALVFNLCGTAGRFLIGDFFFPLLILSSELCLVMLQISSYSFFNEHGFM